MWETTQPPVTGPPAVAAGGCCAWPLPVDATCAAEARRVFRDAVGALAVPDDLVYDGMTMASELAANTMHAGSGLEFDRMTGCPVAGGPELWIYLRWAAGRWELVCKAFDSLAGWKKGPAPVVDGADLQAVSGRGLQVVAGLSGGRWGHHLTRARLGGWKVGGKAVWFAQPLSSALIPACLRRPVLGPCQVARKLERMLSDRGLGDGLLRADEPGAGMSVLSVRRGLTVWCRGGRVSWRTRAGSYEQRMSTDLEDAAEQIVCISEEIDRGVGAGYAGPALVR